MVGLREYKKLIAGLIISAFGLTGCGGVTFDTPIDDDAITNSLGVDFPYQNKLDTFSQNELLENTVTMNFQVFNSDMLPVTGLQESDFAIIENGSDVTKYSLSSMSSVISKADIVFVLDKTASMADEINGVKENVRDFVQQLRSVNILANLCLVTFNDRVQDQCLDFQADDPLTANNENIDDFLDRLERLEVKGGDDDPENQLQGLMSAANITPWRPDAQRITIMITDESFSHTGAPGDAGADAQSYPGTYATLNNQRVTNYIVGPKIPGYASPFQGTPALALAKNYFDISTLIENRNEHTITPGVSPSASGDKSLKDILREIASSLTTEYTITYNINDNNLNPKLPIDSRNIELQVTSQANTTIDLKPVTATFPDGHPVAKKEWVLSSLPENVNDVKVFFNNIIVSSSEYNILNNKISFIDAPPFGSTIKVEYDGGASSGLKLKQLKILNPNVDNYDIIVYYNDIRADGKHYEVSSDASGRYILLSVKPTTLDDADRYRIKELGKLRVTFKVKQRIIDVE